jgi:hypothetical protein
MNNEKAPRREEEAGQPPQPSAPRDRTRPPPKRKMKPFPIVEYEPPPQAILDAFGSFGDVRDKPP